MHYIGVALKNIVVRFYGNCSRSFYVGDQGEQADIKAKFEDGILKVFVPKK